nr:MAG TPA_asm: hypothetical protein [Caudoviricetes sp.]
MFGFTRKYSEMLGLVRIYSDLLGLSEHIFIPNRF